MTLRLYSSRALHAEILQDLGQAIVGGRFAEGTSLPRENELQVQFGASRQTVREAMKILAAKGMIRPRRRAGTFVEPRDSWNLLDPDVLHWHSSPEVPQHMLRDLFEIRYLIEPTSAQRAAERGEPAKVALIERATAAMQSAGDDPDLFYEADIAFHLAVFAASGNELIDRLSHILRPLLEVNFGLRKLSGPGVLPMAYRSHAAVYRAIEQKRPAAARRAMEALLDRAAGELFGQPGGEKPRKKPTRPAAPGVRRK